MKFCEAFELAIQNELLDYMLSVLKDYILEEVKNADFITIHSDNMTNISTHCQLALVLRYIDAKSRAFFRVHYHPERNCRHHHYSAGQA